MRHLLTRIGLVATILLAWAMTARADIPRRQLHAPTPTVMDGRASFYCCYFDGRRMASGWRFDQHGRSAAHRTLRFGTRVRVTLLSTGLSEIVTIEDRGPYVSGRDIDLSLGTAQRIGMVQSGVGRVRLEILPWQGYRGTGHASRG